MLDDGFSGGKVKKYGFLFGAGAEIGYGMPSGGTFSLEIFLHDTAEGKKSFSAMLGKVSDKSPYATFWLPENFKTKSVSAFGQQAFQRIIMDTMENRRQDIVESLNNFDEKIALKVCTSKQREPEGIYKEDLDKAFTLLGAETAQGTSVSIAYNDALKRGNPLFLNKYFSQLILAYHNCHYSDVKNLLGSMIKSLLQLHAGALCSTLSHNVNDSFFERKGVATNLLDELFDENGFLLEVNYSSAGAFGLHVLRDMELKLPMIKYEEGEIGDALKTVLHFAGRCMKYVFGSMLSYRSLIDEYWHYLYAPSSDWAKFCKISVFLNSVRSYIEAEQDKSLKRMQEHPAQGYYDVLAHARAAGRLEACGIATTNYTLFSDKKLGHEIVHLNGAVDHCYDPWKNRCIDADEAKAATNDSRFLVPLLFTQSGTKAMTDASLMTKYVQLYARWQNCSVVTTVGYSFGEEDAHINSMLSSLVDECEKNLVVVILKDSDLTEEDIARKARILHKERIRIIRVSKDGFLPVNASGVVRNWLDALLEI